MSKYGTLVLSSVLLFALSACEQTKVGAKVAADSPASLLASSPLTKPPFAVKGEAEGLLLAWQDEAGAAHHASRRSEVPETFLSAVRVDSLELAPDKRLDPAFIYVADLRKPGADGSYPVRKVERDAYETALASARGVADEAQAARSDQVIIYGASWCGACKSAKQFLTQKGVSFVEKDIEREPGARSEMMSKAQAQGVNASGIPVIDVYGTLLGGFDPDRMEQLLARK